MKLNVCSNFDSDNELLFTHQAVDEIIGQLPRDVVGGNLPTYYLPKFSPADLEGFIKKVKDKDKKFVYNMNALCLGNLEYVRKNYKELEKLLNLLKDAGAHGIRVANPYLVDMVKTYAPELEIIVEGVRSFSYASYYAGLGIKRLVLAVDCNRDFRLIKEITSKLDVKLEVVANDFILSGNPLTESIWMSHGHGSQAPHQNEGFTLAYYQVKEIQEKLKDTAEIVRSPWIRPEDLSAYKEAGVSSVKLVDRNRKSEWQNKVVEAYANGAYDGNLMDLLNGFSKEHIETIDLMVVERPDLAHSKRTGWIYDIMDKSEIVLDNNALTDFLAPILDGSIDCRFCAGCDHCKTFADKAVSIDADWLEAKKLKLQNYLDVMFNGEIYEEEEGFKVQQIKWAEGVRDTFEKMVTAKPEFVHEVAREGIGAKAEQNARDRGSLVVELEDVVRANMTETPEPFRGETVKQMVGLGIEPGKYVDISKYAPAAVQQPQAASGSAYIDGDQAWKLIDTFLTKINEDEEAKKAIPTGKPVTVQYVMPDIDFKYAEHIGEGVVRYERGGVDSPDVTLTLDSQTYHEIMAGEIHPVQASEAKRSKVDGPVFKLIKIQNVLTQINRIYPDIAKEMLKDNPAAGGQAVSGAYRDGDQAWKLIDTFLTKINEDEEAKKAIPTGKPVTVQYVMPDIDFKYVEHLGEGVVRYERGGVDSPDVTLTLDSQTYHEIMAGDIHPVQASEAKRSKVDGPVFKLIKIQNVLTQINKIYPDIAKEILADNTGSGNGAGNSGSGGAYRDGDQAWQLIDTFLKKVNEDEDSKKMIPKGSPVTIQYVMPDIDFKYVEHIGEGVVKYERGEAAKPDVTLTMDSQTYHEIMAGEIHPVQASEAKRSKVDGPVFKLIKIQNVLTQINKIYPAIAKDILSGNGSTPPPQAPAKKEEAVKPDLQSAYRDGDQAWRLIDTFLTKVNEDEDAKKMIPRSTPVTIQYVMPDIDFKYVEHIGDGAVKYERGETAKPDVTLTMDSLTYHEIMAGEIHPVQASEAKRSKIDGPVFKLIKIQNVLTQINKIYPAIAEEELGSDDSEPPPAPPTQKEEGEILSEGGSTTAIVTETVKEVREIPEQNKIVFIDLVTRKVRFETLQPRVKDLFLGGRGVNAYLAYKYIKPGIDPHSGESPIFVSPGLLTGAAGLASSRCSIAGKSPETGFYGEANIGGHFPALMKRHGFDHLIITGKAETPVSIVIQEDSVKVVDAAQHWGKDTFEFQDDLVEELGKGSHCLCIGPAGENLVKFACVRSGRKSAAGRTGLGCLMGAKKLKAIIATPSKNKLSPAKPEEYRDYCKELVKVMKGEPMVDRFLEFGTPWLYDLVNEGVKVGRTYNGLTNEFKDLENIGPKQLLDFTSGRRGCYSCQFACRHVYEVKEGKYAGVTGEGPEYGVMANFGPMLGITRLEPILAANDLINKYGIDSSSMGNMVAWAMELYNKGIITTEDTGGMTLDWGDDDVLMDLIEKVTFREGFGDVLAEGAKGASDIIGRDSARYLSMVKNLPQSCATDMRFFRAFGLGLATATRGADHLRSRAFYEPLEYPAEELKEIYGTDVDSAADSYKGKGRVVQWWEAYMSLFDVLGICKLIGLSNLPGVFMFPEFGKLLELGAGIRREDEELFILGDRTTTMERLFIAREGIRRKDDILPERFYKPLEWENSAPEKIVDYDKFQQILTEYYQWHGWDIETGIPTMGCLERLGIADLFEKNELEIKES